MGFNRRQFLWLGSLSGLAVAGFGLQRDVLRTSTPTVEEQDVENFAIPTGDGYAIASRPASELLFRFAAVADTGTGEKGQYAVANAMIRHHQNYPFNVAILGGDNIYPKGEIERINDVFEKPYKSLLDQKVKFYACLGNHDIATENGNQEVVYPDFNMQGRYYTFTYEPVQFFVLDANPNANWEQQIPWLEDQLSRSKAKWKVVVSHYHLYSSGIRGINKNLINRLSLILKKYHVQLYINGHEHHYERTQPIEGTTFLTCGAGSMTRPVKRSTWTETSASILSFAVIDVYPDQLIIQGINQDNKVFDQGTILI